MSLVDYGFSDEEDDEQKETLNILQQQLPQPQQQQQQRSEIPSNEQPRSSHVSETPFMKLPDASLLLNASHVSSHLVSGFDHSSRVAAAMAESTSRKREANGSSNVLQRAKLPRGNLPHPRSVPDTGRGLLVPPQLSGRSNVVTEDITKLFVRKASDPHLNRSGSPLP